MTGRQITFRGGTRTVIGFGAALVVWIIAFVLLDSAVSELPAWVGLATEISKFASVAAVTLIILRIEGVQIGELGLSRHHVLPAIVAFGGVWVAINAIGVGLASITGGQWGLSLLRETVNPRWEPLVAPWLTTVLLNFLVVGMVEEFVLRGYFQTKVIALLGDETGLRVALGIVTASVLFGLLHTPGAVVAGVSVEGVLGVAAVPALTGVVFGVFYELTQNVYFVALLHGLGNTWPLLVDWGTWSGSALMAFFVGVGIVYLGVTLAYRHWMRRTKQTPVVDRVESGLSPVEKGSNNVR